MIEYIEYKGQKYPTRWVVVEEEIEEVQVATESLENAMDLNPSTPDNFDIEAANIDDMIFFYVPDELIESDEKVIVDYIRNVI